jgi:hypothetical protein
MLRTATPIALLLAASLGTSAPGPVWAQEGPGAWDGYGADPAGQAMPADYGDPAAMDQEGAPPPIPPYVEGSPVVAAGGGYCFDGAHPVDSRVEPGITWDSTPGRHMHGYPPLDLRLFSFQNGCYYFIGDPTDFGYAGSSYSYYGAHPILAAYGGGWCFMIGPHRHVWQPWSNLFVTVGSWYYWQGPYDPFFWTYWPYYHYYYRSYYPNYYRGGAFFRGHMVAPRITHVPRPVRGMGNWRGGGYRGAPMSPRSGGPGMYRGSPMAPRAGMPGPGGYRAAPGAPHGAVPNGYRAAPTPMAPHGGPAPGAFRAPPSVPNGGGYGPRQFSAPAPRMGGGGGGFAPRQFSAPAPRMGGGGANFGGGARFGGGHFGGGHFGGGGRGRR